MKVLIACEFSGVVREAFRRKGHDAWSCDISASLKPSEFHIHGDVTPILQEPWDLVIAHPPCTYLAVSGARWWLGREREQLEAAGFFMACYNANANKVCVENPVGFMSTNFRKPDQYIQPWQFGHSASKKTGLWLRGLPLLKETDRVYGRIVDGKERWDNQTDSGQNNLGPGVDRKKLRSVTYSGIASAMAEQWGSLY